MRVILHIGLPKTATTFLQQEVFSRLGDPEYFKLNDIAYNPPTIIELVRGEQKDGGCIKHYQNKTIFLSREGMSLTGYTPNFQESFDRLKNIFPQAEIIVCLRDKKSFLKSMHNQYIKQYGRCFDYGDFLETTGLDKINFSEMVDILNEKFGCENIHLFSYKRFQEDPTETLKELYEILGVENIKPINTTKKINKSYSPLSIYLTKKLSLFYKIKNTGGRFTWRNFLQKVVDPIYYAKQKLVITLTVTTITIILLLFYIGVVHMITSMVEANVK